MNIRRRWSRQNKSVKIALGLGLVLLLGIILYSCTREDPVVENPDPASLEPLQVYVVDPETNKAKVQRGSVDELAAQYKRLIAGLKPEVVGGQNVYTRLNADGTKTAVLTTERDNLLVVGFKRYDRENQLEAFRYFALPQSAVE